MKFSASRAFLINSAFAFCIAQLVTAAFHEAGHGITAQLLGFSPRIYAFFEDNPTGTVNQNLMILAAGPLTSLVLGSVFLLWYRRQAAHYSFGRLLLFWLAWSGIILFVNYLIVTPLLRQGDTAQFADQLHWPLWVRYLMAALGIALVVALGRTAATTMFAAAPASRPLDTARDRRRFIIGGFYVPLFVGTALSALAGIGGRPEIVLLGLLASVGTIDIVVAALYRGGTVSVRRSPDSPMRIEPAPVALYVALVLLYVVVFSRGMPI